MNLVYVTSTYPSLTETFVAREIDQVVKAGHKVTICILKPNVLESSSKAICVKGVVERRFTHNIFLLLISLLRTVYKKPAPLIKILLESISTSIRKPARMHHIFFLLISAIWFSNIRELKDTEYIHCHFLHTESIVTRWLGILLNVPYGVNAHIVRIRFDRKLISGIVKNASLCFGDTFETVNHLKNLDSNNVNLIRNSINTENIEYKSPQSRYESSGYPLILAVGSLIHAKGFHVLIRACADLAEKKKNFLCRIIGEGIERENLERLINELGIQEKIELPGAVSFNELVEQYKKATIFVMSSTPSPVGTDGLPTVIIEAMAMGLPVIGTNHAAIPEIIENNRTGLLVQPNNPISLSLAISELISNLELCSQLSRNAREKVETEFDVRSNSTQIIKMMGIAILEAENGKIGFKY